MYGVKYNKINFNMNNFFIRTYEAGLGAVHEGEDARELVEGRLTHRTLTVALELRLASVCIRNKYLIATYTLFK